MKTGLTYQEEQGLKQMQTEENFITENLRKMYDQAIDHAIKTVGEDPFVQLAGLSERLINKLQTLKG